ncbi:hypothetical protein PAPYR_8497 [Paratrimastix pyriformis]|uniref:Fascin-like domain-containing protein n=1 Tax=Paratrimastix pyriformis TaxID=342808 RepID=A0ABQ8UF56_9EUKA|nr:hypothetical protein PAPYR_8497 [Paratrimastix pyriformis]
MMQMGMMGGQTLEDQLTMFLSQGARDGQLTPVEVVQACSLVGVGIDQPTAMMMMQKVAQTGGMNIPNMALMCAHQCRMMNGNPTYVQLKQLFYQYARDGSMQPLEMVQIAGQFGVPMSPMDAQMLLQQMMQTGDANESGFLRYMFRFLSERNPSLKMQQQMPQMQTGNVTISMMPGQSPPPMMMSPGMIPPQPVPSMQPSMMMPGVPTGMPAQHQHEHQHQHMMQQRKMKLGLKTAHNKFVCAEGDGRAVCDRPNQGGWETFVAIEVNPNQWQIYSESHNKYLQAAADGSCTFQSSPNERCLFRVERKAENKVALRASHGKYVCAEPEGRVIANRDAAGGWETFEMANHQQVPGMEMVGIFSQPIVYPVPKSISLKSAHGKWMCAEGDGRVVCDRPAPGGWETFSVRTDPNNSNEWYLFSESHHHFLQAKPDGTANFASPNQGAWEKFTVHRPDPTHVQLKSSHGHYLCCEPTGQVVCNRPAAGGWETFEVKC